MSKNKGYILFHFILVFFFSVAMSETVSKELTVIFVIS